MEENVKQTQDVFAENCGKIYGGIINVGILCVLLVFPLYYHDYYYDMLESKYRCYYMIMLTMFAVVALISIAFFVVDTLEFQLRHTKELLRKFSPREIRKTMTLMDWCLLAFLAAGVISTLQSDYLFESFWGNEGRYTGLFLHLIYGAGFFLISRLYRFKNWHGYAFLAVAMLPLLFGITDFFQMDLLKFKEEISSQDMNDYTSTFGNINTYATYIGIVFGCISALWIREKTGWKAALLYLGYLVCVVAMVMGNSDNVVFGVAVVFAFLPLAAFRNKQGIERYILLLSGFAMGIWLTGLASRLAPDCALPLHGFFGALTRFSGIIFLAAAGVLVAVVLHYFRLKSKPQEEDLGNRYVKLWGIFLVLCVAAGIYLLYDANIAGHSERYGALGSYLKFSDEWGTYRGMIWRITLEAYAKQPLRHKIWGFGLDTFGVMTYAYRGETSRICGQVYDSAHNEYLQYLVTLGPVGLAAYIAFLASSLKTILKSRLNREWGLAIAFGVGCYLAQAFVTINLPIVTPIMWMLLSMGVAGCGRSRVLEEEEQALD